MDADLIVVPALAVAVVALGGLTAWSMRAGMRIARWRRRIRRFAWLVVAVAAAFYAFGS